MRSQFLAVEGKEVVFSHNGKVPVLDELNINVRKGHIYGLLGPSGCGKTTLLQCILGRLRPQSGEIRIYGRKPGETGFCIPGKGVGYMPQELALYSEITVEETLQFFGQLFHMSQDQIDEQISFLVHLLKIPDKKSVIKNLSGGQMRRVSFAVALIHKPPLLVLDEPTVGVDPVLRQNIWAHLKTLAMNDHVTIIITTHYVEEARHADMVGLMRKGYLLAEKNPTKLIELHELNSLEEVFLKLSSDDEYSLQRSVFTKIQETMVDSPVNKSYISLSTSVKKIQLLSSDSNQSNVKSRRATKFSIELNSGTSMCSEKEVHALLYHQETKSERYQKCFQRIKALLKKNFIQLKRNIPLAVFQFSIPAIQMVLICLFLGHDLRDLPIAIVNMETEYGLGQKFLEKLDNKTIMQIPYSNLSSAVNSVKSGKTWGALCVEQNFTSSMLKRFVEGKSVDNGTIWGSSIKLYLDMTSQQITLTLQDSVSKSFQDFCEEMLIATAQNPLLAKSPIVFSDPVYGSKDAQFLEFIAPNMLLMVNYFMAVSLTTMSIILEKRQGLLERSVVAGVQCSEILFAILLTLFLVMFVQVSMVLVVVLPVFHIPVHGSIIWVFACTLIAGLGGMASGLFISALSQNEYAAIVYATFVYAANFSISGIIWPVETMTSYLKYISYCMPLTLLTDTIRSVLLRGWSVADNYIWIGVVISLAWILLFILLAALIFKYKR